MNKSLIILAAASVAFASCMKDGKSYEASFTLNETFDNYNGMDDLFPSGKDAVLFPEGFFSANYLTYASKGDSDYLGGGFVLSRQAWKYKEEDGDKEEGQDTKADGNETPTDPRALQYSSFGEAGYGGAPITQNGRGSKTFLYFRQTGNMPEHAITFGASEVGTCTMIGVMVNNSANTIYSILGEDGKQANFGEDITLTFTGYKGGAKTKSVSVLLAGKGKSKLDNEDGTKKDSLITSWTAVSLSDLGSIDCIDMSIEGNTPNGYGDVCIDNLTASMHIAY